MYVCTTKTIKTIKPITMKITLSNHHVIKEKEVLEKDCIKESYINNLMSDCEYEGDFHAAVSEGDKQLDLLYEMFKAKKEGGDFILETPIGLLSIIDVLLQNIDFTLDEMLNIQKTPNLLHELDLDIAIASSIRTYLHRIIEKAKSMSEKKFEDDYVDYHIQSKKTEEILNEDILRSKAREMKRNGDIFSEELLFVLESKPSGLYEISYAQAAAITTIFKVICIDFVDIKKTLLKKGRIANDININ